MADYSFFDENYDSYLPGGGFEGFPSSFDIPSVDLGGFDWSNVDFGGDSYGGFGIDLSSLGDSFGFDLSGITPDMSFYGLDLGDLSGMVPDVVLDEYIDSSTVVPDERIYDAEAQEGGFYGNTKDATYDPTTNTTTIRNPDGTTRTIQGPPIPGGTNTITQKATDFFNRLTTPGPTKQDALLAALLGGLAGLLGKGSGKGANVGYKGEIPKFKAVRGKPGEGTKFIQAAGGGLMDLAQGGRAARYLRGGTDGMADKIKTNIDGKQPARLSHGEFVIPADVVSHLGNGNSDAGADVLYDMMAKVRKARTGTTKQGKQINPQKYTRV
jgi:hypothetical protein